MGDKATTIDHAAGRQRRTGEFGEGGQEVAGVSDVSIHLTRRHHAGPGGEERDETAAFLHGTLLSFDPSSADGGVNRGRLSAAIVAHEDDQGVLAQLEAFEFGDELADELIHIGDVISEQTLGALGVRLSLRSGGAVRGRQDFAVHMGQRVIQEERAGLMRLEPSGRVLVQQVRDILLVLHLDGLAIEHVGIGVAADFAAFGHRLGDRAIPVHAATFVIEFMVETPVRRVTGGRELTPLADHRAGIPSLLQDGRNHDLGLFTRADDGLTRVLRDRAGAEAIASGQDEGTRRAAERDGVETGEPHAAVREGVDVRGLVTVGPVATQLGETEVVGQDVDDIRLRGRGGAQAD